MLEHALNSQLPDFWHRWQPALLALLVALGVRFGGKMQGNPKLISLAVPIGVLVGWVVLGGVNADRHGDLHHKLTVLGVIVVGAGVCSFAQQKAFKTYLPVLVSIVGGWWLVEAPDQYAALVPKLPGLVVITCACALVLGRLRAASAWIVLSASVALWGSLTVVGAKEPWPMMAMVVGAACLSLLGHGASQDAAAGAGDEIGPAAGVVLGAAIADLAAGKFSVGRINSIDVACLTPAMTFLIAGTLSKVDLLVAGVVAAGASVAAAWLIGLGLTYGL